MENGNKTFEPGLQFAYTFAENAEVVKPESTSGIQNHEIEELLKNGDMKKGNAVKDWLQTYKSDKPNKEICFPSILQVARQNREEILKLRKNRMKNASSGGGTE